MDTLGVKFTYLNLLAQVKQVSPDDKSLDDRIAFVCDSIQSEIRKIDSPIKPVTGLVDFN